MDELNDNQELLLTRWHHALKLDENGTPLLAARFAAEQGLSMQLVDLRDPKEAEGPLGAVPGSIFITRERLESMNGDLAAVSPLVLISRDGKEAGELARLLKSAGAKHVAAMDGGISEWRAVGLGITRKPVQRVESLEQVVPAAPREKGPLNLEELKTHLGDPSSVRWTKMANLATGERFSCVDGRDDRRVIGTPGGEAGEFVLMLTALEQAAGIEWDDASVRQALITHLDNFGAFHSHTDRDAFEVLRKAIANDPALQSAVSGLETLGDWTSFVSSPPAAQQEALIAHLTKPEHVGCGHLRLMLQHPEDYAVKRSTVESFIRAFFRLLWAGVSDLHTTLLRGGHREGAVLNVQVDEDVWGLSPIPMISPACSGTQMFINHPQVSSFLRSTVVEFHARGLGGFELSEAQVEKLRKAFDELAALHMGKTLGSLASGLPVFVATFSRAGGVQVEAAGHIS